MYMRLSTTWAEKDGDNHQLWKLQETAHNRHHSSFFVSYFPTSPTITSFESTRQNHLFSYVGTWTEKHASCK
ncbi:hypothetical protein HanHA300_Chr03g0101231 [Helianthus annuus]|nr:hypothetical protein HanHA300_Chr03g0101231 [Helianthus annuus]